MLRIVAEKSEKYKENTLPIVLRNLLVLWPYFPILSFYVARTHHDITTHDQ